MTRLLTVAVLCCFSSILLAQGDPGTITGKVLDFEGSVASGAPVELRNVETGAVLKTTSSAAGVYTFAGLPLGKYKGG
jgi:Carboxypeptidase regulatory-like domain